MSWLFGSSESDSTGQATRIPVELVYFGSAAADEPNAAQAAEEVLKFGGTAADAAVALAFALTVTSPSVASLGGGGVCIVHDPSIAKTEVLDFIAPPSAVPTTGRRPTAVPAMARGLAALHARYGRIDIRNLLASAERLSRFGFPASRATTRDFEIAAEALFRDPVARQVFGGADGQPPSEGTVLRQPALAEVFAEMRRNGIERFYTGPFAERIVTTVDVAGGTLDLAELAAYRPEWQSTVRLPYNDSLIHLAPPPAGAGIVFSQMWHMLAGSGRYAAAAPEERAHLFAEAAKRAFALRQRWIAHGIDDPAADIQADPGPALASLSSYVPGRATPAARLDPPPQVVPENPASTGFVVVDLVGQTVACNLTNYNLFGAGLVTPATGIVLAAAPGREDRNPLPLGPLVVTSATEREFRFAAAGSGGPVTATSLVSVATASLVFEQVLEYAVKVPRLHHSGAPDVLLVEEGMPANIKQSLVGRGHDLVTVPALGRVNAVECPLGLGVATEAIGCFVVADPRGHGLAVEAER